MYIKEENDNQRTRHYNAIYITVYKCTTIYTISVAKLKYALKGPSLLIIRGDHIIVILLLNARARSLDRRGDKKSNGERGRFTRINSFANALNKLSYIMRIDIDLNRYFVFEREEKKQTTKNRLRTKRLNNYSIIGMGGNSVRIFYNMNDAGERDRERESE